MKNISHFHWFNFQYHRQPCLSALFFLALSQPGIAQDYHFSQLDAAPLYLNPALTGNMGFEQRVAALYRNQWGKVLTKPYVTNHLSFDLPHERFGLGGYLMNNRAGNGGFTVNSIILSGSYEITTDPRLYNHLYVGLQLGLLNKNFDPAKYTWDNQYDILNDGGTFDQSIPVGETFNKTAIWLPQGNLGVFYINNSNQRPFHYFGGFVLFNAFGPKETFLGSTNRLPRRWQVHGGGKYFANEKITIVPQWFWMKQANDMELKFDLIGYYRLDEKKQLLFGPSYRNKDAAVFNIGVVYENYVCRISYDINTSTLKTYSKSQGGVEVSLVYQAPLIVRKPSIETQ